MAGEDEDTTSPSSSSSCSCTCDIKTISPIWQLRIMGLILLVMGIAEYLVGIAENYIIAAKSQTDELVFQYSSNILDIFSTIFVFVNTGFLTMVTVRESAANDATPAKRKNISKIFHFGCIVGLASGTVVMVILLVFRVQLFDLLRQSALAGDATTFFSIRAPFIPFEYLGNVLLSLLLGLLQMKQMLIASLITNALYLPMLILLIKFMDNTVAAIAWANGFSIVCTIVTFGYIFCSKSFRTRYEIFDFSAYSRNQRTPLLSDSFPEKETGAEDETKVKDLGKASALLFVKNLCTTAADVIGMVMLAGVLSQNQFIADNVLGNTIQFTSFAAFFNTIINIFGPRCITSGDYGRYKGMFIKAHINNALLAAVSFGLFFIIHTGHISLKKLTTPENIDEVQSILNPIWPIWGVNIILSMYVNLYDTAMINFQNYRVLGIIGVVTSLFVSIPITLISSYKFHSLTGLYIAGTISKGIEASVCAYLFHFKYLKTVQSNDKPLQIQSPEAPADYASLNNHQINN